jgi:lipoprotein-releasing system permease protein
LFEFSIARKYLIPKKRQLSVSLIALLSVLVISLVVWLLLVFLSVMDGIERRWLDKLTTLHAPLRVNPTPAYFASYYYQVDNVSSASNFTCKTIGEKAETTTADPYLPTEDRELPHTLAKPDLDASGALKDPVKAALGILEEMRKKRGDLVFQDYEMSGGLLRLELVRTDETRREERTRSFLSQVTYLATFPDKNPFIKELLLSPTPKDQANVKFLSTTFGALPSTISAHARWGSGIFLPKSFQEGGVLVGDRGYVSYSAAGASSVQEQRLPVYVAGFYDPGIMAVGNRCILAPTPVVRAIHFAQGAYTLDRTISNGLQVWFRDVKEAPLIKQELKSAFEKAGIDQYWRISTYREYDFAKDLFEQFQSDKYLFTLIGVIILVVACCNIISLLVLLVNDKKREIGILQAMGASGKSIAGIFALCGGSLGILGCLIGMAAALFTLHHLDALVSFLSLLQGHEAFNATFYGKNLPQELSMDALVFVLIATPLISLLAGLVPAFKASRLKPTEILRAE